MSTTTDILDSELPKPTFSLLPQRGSPLPEGMTHSRPSAARTLDPVTGLYTSAPSDQPRIYGAEQSLLVEAGSKTNQLVYSADASQVTVGEVSNIEDRNSIIDGETAHLLEATGEFDGPEWNVNTHSGGLEHLHLILEESQSPANTSRVRLQSDGQTVDNVAYDWQNDEAFWSSQNLPSDQIASRILSPNGPNGGALVEIFAWWDANQSFNVNGNRADFELWPDKDGNGNGCIHHYIGFSEGAPGGSPIVTGSSSVIREPDDYKISVGNWFSNTQGTFLIDFSLPVYALSGSNQLFGDFSYLLVVEKNEEFKPTVFYGTREDANGSTIAPYERGQWAVSYDPDNIAVSFDGVAAKYINDGDGRLSDPGSQIEIGGGLNTTANIYRILYTPRALPATEADRSAGDPPSLETITA